MDAALLGVILVIALALAFDFTNGFHDAANSIATIVATRVLTPFKAVLWAACGNFLAYFIFETAVANTIAKDVVDQSAITVGVVFAGLVGAILWNILTFLLGLPTSSSHALIGGMAGAAVAQGGFGVIVGSGLGKIVMFIVLSPLIGLALAFVVYLLVNWICSRTTNVNAVNRVFRKLQLVSSAAFSIGHGANDAQKTMGIILAVLIASNHLSPDADVPIWAVLSAYTAISLGTMFGGWRIVRTMGNKITELQPAGGMAAESAAAATLYGASAAGIPVSTTHTITGAIVGVGTTHRLSAVRWDVAGTIVYAWVLTLPAAFVIGAAVSYVVGAVS